MLAARIHGHGGNEMLRLDDIPVPERKPGEVRIRMVAGGLNRVDLYMRNSGAGITHRLPIILGLDGAGIIEEADESGPLRVGEPVVIYPGQPCETCEFCRKGEEVLCTRGAFSASRSTARSPSSYAPRSEASCASPPRSTSSKRPRSASPGSPPGAWS